MPLRAMRLQPAVPATVTLFVAVCCSTAAAFCTVQTARPASSFLCTEAVQFTVTSDHPAQQVAWSVVDYYGQARATGAIRAGVGATILRVTPTPGVGYYTLSLDYEDGAHYAKVFCVLPHPDDARGDGGLFGIGGAPADPQHFDALWQIGARHLRAEFAWTEVERVQGEYRLDWVREVADLAAERDMQLTVLTGHTPSFYGIRPVNANEMVARKYYLWQPSGTVEWHRYIEAMAATLGPRGLRPEPARGTDTLPRGGRRLVRAWEVWSEADQNFYFGSWDRYLDMLRIAYCTVRSRGRIPVVYGSCGHMTQLQLTMWAGCDDYFDRVAFHPYEHDPAWTLMHWYRNMPQKLVVIGQMRDSAFTECGFHPEDPAHEAGNMPRVYATLKAYGEDLFVRAQCLGAVFSREDDPKSLARIVADEYIPRPAYVAFAVTRWLLESAQYVGPLEAPEGAHVELFLRNGVPMAIAWATDGSPQVTLEVTPSAFVMDALGGTTPLHGPEATVELTQDAVAVLGVSTDELPEAVTAAVERTLSTELGHVSEHDSGYIDPLEQDLGRCIGASFANDLREAVADACEVAVATPPHGAAAFFEVQRLVGDAMLAVADAARESGQLTRLHTNTIWRLARLTEALGAVADGLGERWPAMNNVSPSDMDWTVASITQVRSRVAATTGGAECSFADRLLDRALDRLDDVRRVGGHHRGSWWAATLEARVAHSLTAIEPRQLRRVFAVAEFPTADLVMKGMLLRPGEEHPVNARVYNFLPRDVSGTLECSVPDGWNAAATSGSFTAPAGGCSEAVPLRLVVPGEPRPWVEREVVPIGTAPFPVEAPAGLTLGEQLHLTGDLGFRQLEQMTYWLYLGRYESAQEAGTSQYRPAALAPQQMLTPQGIRFLLPDWQRNLPMLPCVYRP